MTAESAAAVRTFKVGRFEVTLTVPKPNPGAVVCMSAEWSPTQPARLTTAEWSAYRAGRDHALAGIAAELGIRAAVLEL